MEKSLACVASRVDLQGAETQTTVNLYGFQDAEMLSDFWDFHTGEKSLSFPEQREVLINIRAAEFFHIIIGITTATVFNWQ